MNRRSFLHALGAVGILNTAAGHCAQLADASSTPMNTPRIYHEIIRLDLANPWSIARGTAEYKENVIVRYERDGVTGLGEAGHLTAAGQTAAQTVEGIEKLTPFYTARDPWHFFDLPEEAARISDCAPARAAMEMALVDWVGKKAGLPLYRMLGLDESRSVPTSYSIGLDKLDVMKDKVRAAKDFAIIKVKLGRDDDQAIIKALREVTRQPIRVDINEGWKDREQAIRNIEWLASQGVEFVEQPMPRDRIEDARWLKARTPLPIIADEAVHTARDIPAIADAYMGINIKIMKSGGPLGAFRMLVTARAHGLDAMIGCMIESSLGITAAVHLQSLARWLDLDGNLLLKKDPFLGATLKEGRWVPPAQPGLGVRPATSKA